MAARIGHVGKPGNAEFGDILVVDLRERAVALFAIAISRESPVIAIATSFQKFAVNLGKFRVFRPRIIICQLAASYRQGSQTSHHQQRITPKTHRFSLPI